MCRSTRGQEGGLDGGLDSRGEEEVGATDHITAGAVFFPRSPFPGGAELRDANLSGATLYRVDLTHARLEDADLGGARCSIIQSWARGGVSSNWRGWRRRKSLARLRSFQRVCAGDGLSVDRPRATRLASQALRGRAWTPAAHGRAAPSQPRGRRPRQVAVAGGRRTR
jgi:hypothetical protein